MSTLGRLQQGYMSYGGSPAPASTGISANYNVSGGGSVQATGILVIVLAVALFFVARKM